MKWISIRLRGDNNGAGTFEYIYMTIQFYYKCYVSINNCVRSGKLALRKFEMRILILVDFCMPLAFGFAYRIYCDGFESISAQQMEFRYSNYDYLVKKPRKLHKVHPKMFGNSIAQVNFRMENKSGAWELQHSNWDSNSLSREPKTLKPKIKRL